MKPHESATPVQQGQSGWVRPKPGCIKLNIDASIKENGMAMGGIIKNSMGEVLGAFSVKEEIAYDPLVVECLALCDCQVAVHAVVYSSPLRLMCHH